MIYKLLFLVESVLFVAALIALLPLALAAMLIDFTDEQIGRLFMIWNARLNRLYEGLE